MATITQAVTTSPSSAGSNIMKDIEDNLLKAVNELIRRAYEDGEDEPEIVDRKDKNDGPSSGTVQNCEFGLMILTAREWLTKRGRIEGELGKPDKVKSLVLSLVNQTIERTTNANVVDFGEGELKDSPVFFLREPYTAITVFKDAKKRVVFSANLDAAMLIIAFLAAAVEEFDKDLSAFDFSNHEDLRKYQVKTLRDAALFVINQGLVYATR